jgi:hypothetical protein
MWAWRWGRRLVGLMMTRVYSEWGDLVSGEHFMLFLWCLVVQSLFDACDTKLVVLRSGRPFYFSCNDYASMDCYHVHFLCSLCLPNLLSSVHNA